MNMDQKETRSIEQMEQDLIVLEALSSNYGSIFYVDYDKDEVTPYRMNDAIEKWNGAGLRAKPKYSGVINAYINTYVMPEDQQDMLERVKVSNLAEQLSADNVCSHDYRVFRDDMVKYFRMKVVNISKEPGLHQAVVGFADISSQKIQELERFAYVDAVTGGDNYIRFKEKIAQQKSSGYFVAMDIGSFKIVNRACGVKQGDMALKRISEAINHCIRSGFSGHINADQFVFFSPDQTEKELIATFKHLSQHLEELSHELVTPVLTPYFGVTKWDANDDVEQVYGYAMVAKHQAKAGGDKHYAFYSQEDSERILKEKKLSDMFEVSLLNEDFQVWYQPKYSPITNEMVGAEALVRMRSGEQMVPPGVFIPVYEKNGMIPRLDEYVFRKVCEQQKKWTLEGKRILPISVNLSRVSLYFQDVVDQYRTIVEEYGLNPQLVPLEITESVAVANVDIKALADRFFLVGFALHMDDFGTGYSSLSTLNMLHFNTLKLDKSLIDYIGNYGGEKLLEHTIALAKELGLHVTAEGVETAEQVEFLKKLFCDSIQGYYYSKPLPLEEFEKKL